MPDGPTGITVRIRMNAQQDASNLLHQSMQRRYQGDGRGSCGHSGTCLCSCDCDRSFPYIHTPCGLEHAECTVEKLYECCSRKLGLGTTWQCEAIQWLHDAVEAVSDSAKALASAAEDIAEDLAGAQ